jgi:hypothetical protein
MRVDTDVVRAVAARLDGVADGLVSDRRRLAAATAVDPTGSPTGDLAGVGTAYLAARTAALELYAVVTERLGDAAAELRGTAERVTQADSAAAAAIRAVDAAGLATDPTGTGAAGADQLVASPGKGGQTGSIRADRNRANGSRER